MLLRLLRTFLRPYRGWLLGVAALQLWAALETAQARGFVEEMPDGLEAAIAQGGRVHPGYAGEIEAGVSRAWGNEPYQLGAWPEADEAPEALQRPDGAVHFAGDQASALPGWQEGAALSAHAAVAAIARRVAGR